MRRGLASSALGMLRTRPDLVRKLVVAAANPGGTVPGAPDPNPKVRATMTMSCPGSHLHQEAARG